MFSENLYGGTERFVFPAPVRGNVCRVFLRGQGTLRLSRVRSQYCMSSICMRAKNASSFPRPSVVMYAENLYADKERFVFLAPIRGKARKKLCEFTVTC